ncbi:MAG: T9SS type A sorting domain-containing protein [Bacteroidetes bacterium]|nr:MAG: T9SS type A sorting domain-containing protein [Bacteroidota bacterium]
MKKTFFIVLLFVLGHQSAKAQHLFGAPTELIQGVNDPTRSGTILEKLYENYEQLQSNPDTSLIHAKKLADRWMKYEFSRYNVVNGNEFSNADFYAAMRSIYTSPLHCNDNDMADWRSDGPSDLPDWTLNSIIQQNNGRVDAVYNHPDNFDVMCIGTYTSGIFRSINHGETWKCVTDNLDFPVLGVGKMIMSPSEHDRIVAVTGILTDDELHKLEGGIIYSEDAGLNWNKIDQELPQFLDIVYHPTIPHQVYGVTAKEIWVSTNDGLEWKSLGAPNTADLEDHWFMNIGVIGNNIFVTTNYFGNYWNSKIFRGEIIGDINDGNVNWSNDLALTLWPNTNVGRSYISNVVGDRIYIQLLHSPQPDYYQGRTFKSVDGGQTFQFVTDKIVPGTRFDKNELIASVNNENVFYYGSIWRMRRFDETIGQSVIIVNDPNNPGHHDDYRGSQIINDGGKDRIILGNDGGVALVDDGLGIGQIESLNGDLAINMLHAFDVHERTGRTVYAFQDHAMRYRDEGNSYSYVFLQEGSFAMVQQLYPDATVGEDAANSKVIDDHPNSPRPIVQGNNFGKNKTTLGGGSTIYRHFPDRFARALGNGEIAMNRGEQVSEVESIQMGNPIGAVAVCQRKPQTLYAANNRYDNKLSKLFKSTDDGKTWQDLTSTSIVSIGGQNPKLLGLALDWEIVRSIAIDPWNEETLYCGISGTHRFNGQITDERFRVIKSTNGGLNFEDFSEGLPAVPVDYLLTVESDNGLIFCATNVGVYYRTKDMNRWECFSNNLPKVRITGMKFDYCQKQLYVSTYGRGVWKTPVNLDLTNSFAIEVASNETWDQSQRITDNVIVKSGSTLTIKTELHFDADKKIVVEPGAKLVLDYAHLTAYCGSFWQGIEVWGNSDKSQLPPNQGIVVMSNSTIEHAKEALRFWQPDNYASTGGFVDAQNCQFKNNWRSAEFIYYHNYSKSDPDLEIKHKSSFVNCDFTWDDAYLGGGSIAPAVTMYHVTGPLFSGCDFIDSRTFDQSTEFGKTIGIGGLDASFTVRGTNLNNSMGQEPDELYDDDEYDISQFRNLSFAIRAQNATSLASISVDHCRFAQNNLGVTIEAVDNADVTRNYFYQNAVNLYTDNSTAYTIEGNIFRGKGNTGITYGTITSNSGIESNEIYQNYFIGLSFGAFAQGVNNNDVPNIIDGEGLEWKCNNADGNLNDFEVNYLPSEEDFGQGVRRFQGTNNEPAGNLFSINIFPGSQQDDSHIKNLDPDQLNYIAFKLDPIQIPTVLSGNVNVIEIDEPNNCESNFVSSTGGGPGLGFSGLVTIGDLKTELKVVTDEIKLRNQLLHIQLQLGDREELHDLVSSLNKTNRLEIKNALMEASPFLSEKLLRTVGGKPIEIFPRSWYRDLILANAEVTYNKGFMAFLENNPEVMPKGLYEEILSKQRGILTERGTKSLEILDLKSKAERISNVIMHIEKNSTENLSWNAYENHLMERDHQLLKAELVDLKLGQNKRSESEELLGALELERNDFDSPWNQRSAEDFVLFKNYEMTLMNDQGIIESLSPGEISELEYMAQNFVGKAARQAQNLLCFFANRCEIPKIVPGKVFGAPGLDKSLSVESSTLNSENFRIKPNPNQGMFEVSYLENCKLDEVIIMNSLGQSVTFEQKQISESEIQVKLNKAQKGIYLIRLTCEDGTIQQGRMLLIE